MSTRFSLRNDTGQPSGNTAAISLWQKFSLLQQSIEKCIKDRKEIDARIDASQMRQSDLRELRRESLQGTCEAERKLIEIEEKLAALQNHYDIEIQPVYASSLWEKRNSEIRMKQWKEYKALALQLFLDRSANFRSKCKRLQMGCESLDLTHAKCQAWMYVFSYDRGDDADGVTFDDFTEENDQFICPTDDDESKRDNPLLWEIPKNDYELLDLAEKYKQELDVYEIFCKELDTLKERKSEYIQQERTLTERASLMQKQLDRILSDCSGLESQIEDQRASRSHQEQSIAISDRSIQHQQHQIESLDEPPVKRPRTNPYCQSKTNRSNLSALKRRKALRSVVLGSTAVAPVSSPLRSELTTKEYDFSRFQHGHDVTADICEVPSLGRNAHDTEEARIEGKGSERSSAHYRASAAIDDDDEDDDLFSFVGLRK
ncbi:hypothetical protein FisN_12Hh351 [Fistulifera solaris]|uniref:Uncharacterized protein n=1 Tax=Fistulifera solaris TaxID=1519565 RepID=A0A1Z5KBX6_FISSO|nr:hypothetical protein FisN_12Hh351 [Fistulifera solaris]|eukprot:GAX23773.1 hypothetical protein FisN_12Hh351 [Fistulifera solaris]